MPLPDVTHLQFAIIDVMGAKERTGEEIRRSLFREHSIKRTLAAFYMLMKRLEDSGFITGRYRLVEIGSYTAKQRLYKVTGQGAKAFQNARDWYARGAAPSAEWSPA